MKVFHGLFQKYVIRLSIGGKNGLHLVSIMAVPAAVGPRNVHVYSERMGLSCLVAAAFQSASLSAIVPGKVAKKNENGDAQ
jgi:hypothetical protein